MPRASNVRNRHAAEAQPDVPREGGWGIVVVIAAHLSLAIQTGLMRCGGVLYLSWKDDFEINDKETAAVQSILSSVGSFSGLLGGVLTKRFGCRVSEMVGGMLTFIGLLCSYWVTDIYQLYITISIVGVGNGICYNSALVAVAMHFKRKYKTAHAVASAGNGTGLMLVPPLLQLLVERYGWRGAFLIVSAIAANCVAFGALFRANRTWRNSMSRPASNDDQASNGDSCHDDDVHELEPMHLELETTLNHQTAEVSLTTDTKNPNAVVNLLKKLAVSLGFHLFVKSYRFALMCFIEIQYVTAYMGFIVYLVPRAQSVGVAPYSAAILLSIVGIGSLLGRLGNGLLVSWKISVEHVTAISMVISGVSLLLMNLESYYILAIASFLYGFASGFCFAIVVVLVRYFVGVRNLAIGLGLYQILVGVGSLIGPVFAGWILDMTAGAGSYPTVFYVGSAICFICAVQMLLLPLLRRVEPGIDICPTDV